MVDIELLHKKLFDLMAEFHTFCTANSLCYYAVGGTALGMKRHHGFIPWDDDVDIGMPRNDYERFILLKDSLPSNLEVKYYRNTDNYPHHALKLIDKKTTLVENNYRNILGGLYVDIFPLDGVIKDSGADLKRRKKIYSITRKIMWKCSTISEHNIIRKAFSVYCKCHNLKKLHEKLEKEIIKFDFYTSTCVANLLGAYGEREIVDRDVFGKPTLYKFEEGYFFGPERIDDYLRCLYGDYMKLPPVEKRILHHNYYRLDLEKSYLDISGESDNAGN